jgi:ABC-type ATPase with predicted acetyltransferase domain
MKALNSELSTISRVVIHPKYRSIDLGEELIGKTLPRVGTPCVEMIAVMAKYNPFDEKAGMQKIMEQKPPEEAKRIADVLSGFRF